jgi:cytochrome P450
VRILDEFSLGIIAERRKEKEEDLNSRTDLLSRYMRMTDEEGRPFTDEYLRDIVMNFTCAFYD